RHAAIMDRYDPQKRVALIVGEYGIWTDVEPGTNPGFLYQQNSLRDALVASTSLDILNKHADRVRGANIAQMVNVLQSMILTRGATATSATGRALTGPAINSINTFEQPDVVRPQPFTGARVANGRLSVTLPPRSVVALELR